MKKKSIFIDVDGTLLFWPGKPGRVPRRGEAGYGKDPEVNRALCDKIIDWHRQGCHITVWSTGGEDHAKWAVNFSNMSLYVNHICSKPQLVIDDNKNWSKRMILQSPGSAGDG